MVKIDWSVLGKTIFSGALIHMAPNMIQGAMSEYLWKVNLREFGKWVREDVSLWDKIPDDKKKTVMELAPKLGDFDWLTLDWVMESGRSVNPALYSALEGWPEGLDWLQRQIDDIKSQLGGVNARRDPIPDQARSVSELREPTPVNGSSERTTETAE